MAIGVIAFGSLLSNPDVEIEAATDEVVAGLMTPFRVEFARSSEKRDGAPTLVPHDAGSQVSCSVIVLNEQVGLDEARDLVYRRERNDVGSGKTCTPRWRTWIPELRGFGPTDVSLYTALPATIARLSADHLAELAIASARAPAGQKRRDGISYLDDALGHGIRTPLSDAYRRAILDQFGVATLREAWEACRAASDA